jgi:hypothetical protein
VAPGIEEEALQWVFLLDYFSISMDEIKAWKSDIKSHATSNWGNIYPSNLCSLLSYSTEQRIDISKVIVTSSWSLKSESTFVQPTH